MSKNLMVQRVTSNKSLLNE